MTKIIVTGLAAAAAAAGLPAGPAATWKIATPLALPDRLSIDPRSPFYDPHVLARGVGVRFKGTEIFNCAEYCISERWVRRIPAGGTYRNTIKLQGDVEAWFRS